MTNVSWADDGAAELLWVCCLLQRFELERCFPLVSAIAAVARGKEMSDRGSQLFFSRMALLSTADAARIIGTLNDSELSDYCIEVCSFFSLITGVSNPFAKRLKAAKRRAMLGDVSNVVKAATSREDPLALKAMALFIKCDVESECLVIGTGFLTRIDPRSLDQYPSTAASKMAAGLLRAHMNTMMMVHKRGVPFCEKLWPALIMLEECQ